ncbi:MAG TPA: lipoyl synthase [Chlorobaculum sp.]|uniref:Lipoyl synthase n=1 Tax=Chlorobaculum tepidum (strain ATCC 49652 / DSM 12025 / NBRC 103806 / TLS) TaxID=194439 RepID=LIPA_CHLTE|nr:lipoyl synthase [Chlorobaculum tepidum]Q8KDH2.1 RecName: Full=Lipoyl synthase; AltName: Full=Lip-syn; Short=LS; AltName: Full=Lipoate synthase; AltName: Full=Lipoic acid synthase; AltName: Full=Sulfur insertion protein LipA [Chlorobaculum tepidum TLS]AAM72311.1 lipoic acid synthetase [Chlorobaculum tepidum TLS]HBU22734.1 lipoyl synthase [Chlorobaculum sp.]
MNSGPGKKPDWLKIKLASGSSFASTRKLLNRHSLHTVCRSAMCPNLHECWSKGTATFLLLGNVCTRSCRFCAVGTECRPAMPDPEEPSKIAEAVKTMKLRHAVLTSVNRDDLADGGATHWVETIRAIREVNPGVSLECLIPDFSGNEQSLDLVMQELPEVLNHNIETVPSRYAAVRPQALYERSLAVIERAKRQFRLATKSGMMVGMGETEEELEASLHDLRGHGCDMVTIGQYLQPTAAHLPVSRYVTPEEFERYREIALDAGFRHVQSGPFVRSSYHAEAFEPVEKIS